MIYLDHNATTPLDRRVFEAMTPYMTDRWGNPSSPYSFGNQARLAVEKARRLGIGLAGDLQLGVGVEGC